MEIRYDQPTSQGMANALKRAHQLADVVWTPITKMPMTVRCVRPKNLKDWPRGKWPVWKPVTGLPYSSMHLGDNYVGFNISLETWFTALANPKSVLYTRDATGSSSFVSSWYGTVCSSFVSYAYAVPRTLCRQYMEIPGIVEVKGATVQDIRLMDGLLCSHHIMLITAVGRNEAGEVVTVDVTESTPPRVVTTTFTPEEFTHFCFPKYRLIRYLDIDKVPYAPSPYVHVEGDPETEKPVPNKTLLPDYGNKANYLLGEPVELNVMEAGWDELVAEDADGHVIYRAELGGPGVYPIKPRKGGFYRAYCVKDGEKSEAVEWFTVDLPVEPEVGPEGVVLRFAAADGVPFRVLAYRHSDMGIQVNRNLTEEEVRAGRAVIPLSAFAKGNLEYDFRITVHGVFGDYNGFSKTVAVRQPQ